MSTPATQDRHPPAAAQTQASAPAPDAATLEDAVKETERRRTTLTEAAAFLGVPAHKIYDILRNLWKPSKGQEPLSNNEIYNGLVLIARFELDPFAREIYVTRGSHGLMVIVGIDGWIKILDRTEHYDGFDREYGYSEDGKELLWIQTTIHSTKRKHPTVHRAFMAEYKRICGPVASQIPVHMLGIFSLRHAARLFVPLGAYIMTEEEAKFLQREETPAAKEPSGNARLKTALQSRKDGKQPRDESTPPIEEPGAYVDPESQEDPTPDAPDEDAVWWAEFMEELQPLREITKINELQEVVLNGAAKEHLKKRAIEACGEQREKLRRGRGGKSNAGQKSFAD